MEPKAKKSEGNKPQKKGDRKKNDSDTLDETNVKELMALQIVQQNENMKNQIEVFEKLFRKQNKFSKKLLKTLENTIGNNPEKTVVGKELESEFRNYSTAFHNIAQTNISKKEGFSTKVKLDSSYYKKLDELTGKYKTKSSH